MAKKREIKEVIKDRKSIIREHLLKVTEVFKPKIIGDIPFASSFDMQKIVELPGTKGLLRQSLPDFKMEDKKLFIEICQDLRKEEIFYHKAGPYWARMK